MIEKIYDYIMDKEITTNFKSFEGLTVALSTTPRRTGMMSVTIGVYKFNEEILSELKNKCNLIGNDIVKEVHLLVHNGYTKTWEKVPSADINPTGTNQWFELALPKSTVFSKVRVRYNLEEVM